MDSLTHIYFAHQLLEISQRDKSAAVCSLFPQIDRQPAYLHRMYAHPFYQIKKLAPVGAQIYRGDSIDNKSSDYSIQRFIEDVPRMRSFMEKFIAETHQEMICFQPNMVSIILAYVSHTYQDIFNNPMQAFLPMSMYPCAKWELWAELDPIEFRVTLYNPENIAAFRQEFFSAPLWNTSLESIALIKAMVRRTAIASIIQLPQATVDSAFDSLNLGTEPVLTDVKNAEEFLIEHENLLAAMIRKYSTRTSVFSSSEERLVNS